MNHNGPRAGYRFVYGFEAVYAANTPAVTGPWHHGLRCEALTEEEAHTLLAECQRAIQDTGSHLPLRMLAQDEALAKAKAADAVSYARLPPPPPHYQTISLITYLIISIYLIISLLLGLSRY